MLGTARYMVILGGTAGYIHGTAGYMVGGTAGYIHGTAGYMVGGVGGGPCDYSVTPSPNWTWILIWDCFGSGFGTMGTGLWTLD